MDGPGRDQRSAGRGAGPADDGAPAIRPAGHNGVHYTIGGSGPQVVAAGADGTADVIYVPTGSSVTITARSVGADGGDPIHARFTAPPPAHGTALHDAPAIPALVS